MGIFRQFHTRNIRKQFATWRLPPRSTRNVLAAPAGPSEYEMYYKLGYRFLACGSDGSFVNKAATDMVKKLSDLEAAMKKN
jgi:4-hydroxy-2-oxoheptanedioate aldolase